ncbi:flagellar assembly peptidoglycan hydrolase FlgJ [Derxia gummosa]|uniref:Peptidoglycan hydrolase FlgJ n=1 Tax=Derxia gummosa DSM 723 TaxID=1121388 RepID=A0A8B6X6C5_9BURK|nr:flagellar assembly peptidoglycan hydrolase FlgJ [Derxia gummosa]
MAFSNAIDSSTGAGLASDSRSLDSLRAGASKDPHKALRGAAQQFESVFMNTLMKSMRDTVPQGELTGGNETKNWQGMFDQELVASLGKANGGKGVGLADMIVQQLAKGLHTEEPDAARIEKLKEATQAAGDAAGAAERKAPAATGATGTAAAAPQATGAQGFVRQMWSQAREAESRTGVPAQFMIGQAALETGWGKRQITGVDGSQSNNLFGIKATPDWKGRTVDAVTTEYVNGKAVRRTEKFRAYDSYADSFADYAQIVGSKPRYAPVLQQTSARGFATALQSAGYATDPAYADKLTATINTALRLSRTA